MVEPLRIAHINHVALPTKRLQESIRFYQNVLGCKLISRPGFSFAGAWLYVGGIQIHLIEDHHAPDPAGDVNTRGVHVAFSVDDIEEVQKNLVERGIPFARRLIEDRGIHQIYIRDPDGHTIEIGSKYWKIDE